MKVGIVGYGWVAGAHIDALNSIEGVEDSIKNQAAEPAVHG